MDITQFYILYIKHLKTTITSNLCERLLKDLFDLTAISYAYKNSWEGRLDTYTYSGQMTIGRNNIS